ncbi:integrase catalytic domain-containing protein [Trichonephila clavipes]|nr:integrase catalytic domain-containing protein [Trichonephila clavipes]
MKILPDGRYELCLPFESEAIDLSSNKDLTWKRHRKMCERAQRNGIPDNYKVVFKEWEELEIIEKIEEKDRFRRYPIGLSADIEKAFLQRGFTPKHRDFSRFFYPDEGEEIVYRHCRVVFGVSSTPFLLATVLAHLLENVPADDTQQGSKLKLSFYVDNCVTGVNKVAQQEEFVLSFKEILSLRCFNLRNSESNVENELESAEIELIRSVQAQRFTEEKLISILSVFREGGRRTVRKTWNACVKCRRFKSKSPMTDPVSLPSDRVKDAAVLEVVGVDLAGPLGANKKLIDIDWNEVSRYADTTYNMEIYNSHSCLVERLLGEACENGERASQENLRKDHIYDLTPITPARFLFEIPTADTKDLDVRDANHFRKRLRFRANVIEELKRRFRNEYLGQLIERRKQHPQSSNIQLSDIVLIGDD